jgi:hypothetical protein
VVVGAAGDTNQADGSTGHAYIFSTSGALIATLRDPDAQSDGGFGSSVAINGTTIAVGAPGETVSGDSGAGHVYTFSASTDALIKTFVSPNAQTGGHFGGSVAISGSTTLVVGAGNETVSGYSSAGHAYIFSTAGTLIATLSSANVQGSGHFGYSVAITSTSSGSSDVVVGAPFEKNSNDAAGHAYVFSPTGSLIEALSGNTNYLGDFGNSVAISGTTAAVGAYGEKLSSTFDAGRVYVFHLS